MLICTTATFTPQCRTWQALPFFALRGTHFQLVSLGSPLRGFHRQIFAPDKVTSDKHKVSARGVPNILRQPAEAEYSAVWPNILLKPNRGSLFAE